jgi:hypothetical protein
MPPLLLPILPRLPANASYFRSIVANGEELSFPCHAVSATIKSMSHHSDVLGPGGAIARALANYEPRPQQLSMAEAVAAALAQGRHLLAEAGTGVGKSFAYLVPALQAAEADDECRVVISTHTISLQEQLVRKDIPFLQRVMPSKCGAVLVKGRGNYLSQRRLRVAQNRGMSLLGESGALEQLDTLAAWAQKTRDGSRSDLERAIAWANAVPITTTASTSRRAARSTARASSSSTMRSSSPTSRCAPWDATSVSCPNIASRFSMRRIPSKMWRPSISAYR